MDTPTEPTTTEGMIDPAATPAPETPIPAPQPGKHPINFHMPVTREPVTPIPAPKPRKPRATPEPVSPPAALTAETLRAHAATLADDTTCGAAGPNAAYHLREAADYLARYESRKRELAGI